MRHHSFALVFTCALASSSGLLHAGVVNQHHKILASDGAAGDWFAWAVAMNNGVLVAGASRDNDNGNASGSAYLFNVGTAAQLHKLLPDDGEFGDGFGWSVAIDDGVAAVGAPLDDDTGFRDGSAYLFEVATGAQLFQLHSSDAESEDKFGFSISMDNGVVAVGAPFESSGDAGSAYLFDVATGNELAILLPEDNPPGANFGISIAIDNGFVVVGAHFDDSNGEDAGSAYIFDATTGVQLAKLFPDDGLPGDYFGISVAIERDIVVVGAGRDNDNGTNSGSAYLFSASSGDQLQKLLADDGAANDQFGISVSINNGVVAVGARSNGANGLGSGAAYLYDTATGTQLSKLVPSDGSIWDGSGRSIVIDDGLVAVGTPFDDEIGNDSGSVYVFEADAVPCAADLGGDGEVGFTDLVQILAAWGPCGSPCPEDLDGDGSVGFGDLLEMLSTWGPCP